MCENNGFAVHSNLRARQSYAIIDHPRSYGIPVAQCAEGFDFAKVHELFSRIVEEVRRSRSPYFVEIRTHRHKEHVGPGEDYDAGYRSSESLESWNSKDPLVLDRELAERYRPSINAMIDDAVEFAERSPWPSDDQVLTDVI